VGAVGAALGGGHGRLQGKHGLSMDAIQSMRVILANGTILTTSATENSDLFWGMRGAGQNFGIVVSAVLKTFPQTNNGMHYDAELAFSGDKLEAIFELTNKLMDQGWPAELGAGLAFPASQHNKSIIALSAIFAGPADEARKYINQYAALGPLVVTEDSFTFADLGHKAAGGAIAAGCTKDRLRSGHTLNQRRFDIPTMRRGFDAWAKFSQKYPSLAPWSGQLWEVFGTQAIKARPSDSTAYPNREHVEILQIISLDYDDASISQTANDFAKKWIDEYRKKSGYDKWYAYQNYASDTEPLEAIYGYEPWRLQKLRALKSEYDRDNVFNGYHGFLKGGY
jgi:fumiquinazoline A oxidase